jgi:Iron-sulfur cluster-binding domain
MQIDPAPPQVKAWPGRVDGGSIRSLLQCHFDIVNGCQLACIGCPNSTLQPKVSRITPEDFHLCLGNIDVKAIVLFRLFNFGEPLLHPDLPVLLRQIPRQKWRAQQIELSTNAQFARWEVLEEALRERVLTRLVVSCDGDGTPAEYERLRPPSRWSKLVEFLTRAAALRDRWHPGLELLTRTICTTPEGQERWRALLLPLGWTPEFRGWMTLPEAAVRFEDQRGGLGVCEFLRRPASLFVTADGDVVPCCDHPKAALLGNLKHQTASAILAGSARRDLAGRLAAGRAAVPICNRCTAT